MPKPKPLPKLSPSPPAQGRWTVVQSLRQQAERELAVIAGETGPGSSLLDRCQDAWESWERQAVISILHHDVANAEVILDRGVHVLRQALDLVRKDRLSEDDAATLVTASSGGGPKARRR
jgi:hypothetical protein